MIRIFKHYLPRWSLLLIALEGLLYTSAVYAGVAVRFWRQPLPEELQAEVLLPRALLFALLMIVSMTATGRYQRLMDDGLPGEVLNVSLSFLFGIVGMSLLFYIFPTLFIGRGAFGYTLLFALLGVILVRWFFHGYLLDQDRLRHKVLVIGASRMAAIIPRGVSPGREGYQVVGYWPVADQRVAVNPAWVIQTTLSLADYARQVGIDVMVVTLDHLAPSATLMDELMTCKASGIRVVDAPSFFEGEFRFIPMDAIDPYWWALHSDGVGQSLLRDGAKKVFDLFFSITLLVIFTPIMLLTALAIWLEGRGRQPILYQQRRVGYGGKEFALHKFRSMQPDAEKDGPRWAQPNDSRVTTVGRLIRITRIDELPQLFNVLRGEMSIVGPRPERPEFVSTLKQSIPYYLERLRVKPGITGWAQICYGYGASEQDAAEKLKYDLYYVKNNSIFLDCLVVIQSMEVVLFGRGIKAPR